MEKKISYLNRTYADYKEALIEMSERISESEGNLISGTEEIKTLLCKFIDVSDLMMDAQQCLQDISESLNKFPEQQKEMNHLYENASEIMKNSLILLVDHVDEVLDKKTDNVSKEIEKE